MTITTKTTVRRFIAPRSLDESLLTMSEVGEGLRLLASAKNMNERFSQKERNPLMNEKPKPNPGITFASQNKLPKLPIPELEDTLKKYLTAVKPLQTIREHAETKQAVEEFLRSEGPELQERLKKYANGKTSYIEQFCKCYLIFVFSSTNSEVQNRV